MIVHRARSSEHADEDEHRQGGAAQSSAWRLNFSASLRRRRSRRVRCPRIPAAGR